MYHIYYNTTPLHSLGKEGLRMQPRLLGWTPEALHTLPSVTTPGPPTPNPLSTEHPAHTQWSVISQRGPALCCLLGWNVPLANSKATHRGKFSMSWVIAHTSLPLRRPSY